MKRITIFLGLALCSFVIFGSSCGVYRYHQPIPNPVLFHNAGEVQLGAGICSAGYFIKGGASLTDNVAVMGQYTGNLPELDIRAREAEFGLGYYKGANHGGYYFAAGLGRGHNFSAMDNNEGLAFDGTYWKPFVQFNVGITNGPIIDMITGDLVFTMKATRMIYDGERYNSGTYPELRSRYTLFEPAFMMGFGTRMVHFDLSIGMPLRLWVEPLNDGSNARTFPYNAGVGMRFLINRKQVAGGE